MEGYKWQDGKTARWQLDCRLPLDCRLAIEVAYQSSINNHQSSIILALLLFSCLAVLPFCRLTILPNYHPPKCNNPLAPFSKGDYFLKHAGRNKFNQNQNIQKE